MTTYRGDLVGSLLRPPYLVEARARREAGRLTPAEFKRIEDRAVDEAVALQEGAGLGAIADGELRGRIAEAARYMPLERLALSPQCGFASTMEGNQIAPEDQRRKLQVVAETARAVWGG